MRGRDSNQDHVLAWTAIGLVLAMAFVGTHSFLSMASFDHPEGIQRCPWVALRLPMANGCDPFGIKTDVTLKSNVDRALASCHCTHHDKRFDSADDRVG